MAKKSLQDASFAVFFSKMLLPLAATLNIMKISAQSNADIGFVSPLKMRVLLITCESEKYLLANVYELESSMSPKNLERIC